MAQPCDSIAAATERLRGEIRGREGPYSRLVQFRADIDHALSDKRALSAEEEAIFRSGNNQGTLFAVEGTGGASVKKALHHIRNCIFRGNCIIIFSPGDSQESWAFEYSTFEDSIIAAGATVQRTSLVRKCLVRKGALLDGCGYVLGPVDTSTFGTGVAICAGVEGNGRQVPISITSSLEELARVSLNCRLPSEREAMQEYLIGIDEERALSRFQYSVIDTDAMICNSPYASEVIMFPAASIRSGARVSNSTLGYNSNVESGSDVQNSVIQEKGSVKHQAIVCESLLCENTLVENHAKITSSVIGPKSSMASGEVTASIIGPMIGFHHQSLLIACFWPRGRGNIAYGANIGSNHTSRAPDQSIWPGEGCFFGLSSVAKLPVNMANAPYSIVASGVTFGPGVLDFPFSLVTQESSNRVRVSPGWCLVSNAYFVERCSQKMASRAPSGYATEVFRTDNMREVLRAYDMLTSINTNDNWTLDGFFKGKMNILSGVLTRDDTIKGIRAYTLALKLFALRTMISKDNITAEDYSFRTSKPDFAATGLDESLVDIDLLNAIKDRFFAKIDFPQRLRHLYQENEDEWLSLVRESKIRDHKRGDEVFPLGWYTDAVNPVDDDLVIKRCRTRLDSNS